MVIGADGRNSSVARLARAREYGRAETVSIAYYGYWNDVATDKVEIYFQPGRVVGVFPTHAEQALIFVQWPVSERGAVKSDIEGNYQAALGEIAPVADRLTSAKRHGRLLGMAEILNFFREPFGPGWALVGDAGHHKDPLVARGKGDAWRDSHGLAEAVISGWEDEERMHDALTAYQVVRDAASTAVAEQNVRLARLDLALDEMPDAVRELTMAEVAGEKSVARARLSQA